MRVPHRTTQPAPVPLPDEKLIDDYLADYELMDGEGGCHTPCFAMSMYASRADRDVAMLAEIDRLLIQRDDYKSDLMAMQRERDALRETQAKFGQVQHDLLSQIDALREQLALAESVRAAQVAGLVEGAEKLRERVKVLEDALRVAFKWGGGLTVAEGEQIRAALKGEAG